MHLCCYYFGVSDRISVKNKADCLQTINDRVQTLDGFCGLPMKLHVAVTVSIQINCQSCKKSI